MKKNYIKILVFAGIVFGIFISAYFLMIKRTQEEVLSITTKISEFRVGMRKEEVVAVLGQPKNSFRFESNNRKYIQLTFSSPGIVADMPELIFDSDSLLVFVTYGERVSIGNRPKIDAVFPP